MEGRKLEVGRSTVELFPMEGKKLERWVALQLRYGQRKAEIAMGLKKATEDDLLDFMAAGVHLTAMACRCSTDLALTWTEQERLRIVIEQDALNKIPGIAKNIGRMLNKTSIPDVEGLPREALDWKAALSRGVV